MEKAVVSSERRILEATDLSAHTRTEVNRQMWLDPPFMSDS